MTTSQDRHTALMLSLWHCKVAWFFAHPDNKHANRLRDALKKHNKFDSIYGYMKPLRLVIHMQPPDGEPSVSEITKHFNSVVLGSGIPNDVWTEELHSLMEEIVSISHVLKDYQHRHLVKSTFHNTSTTLRDLIQADHIHDKPRFTVSLLTLWYWLIVWCFPNDYSESNNIFIEAVESHSQKLAVCLVDSKSTVNKSEMEILFNNLVNTIKPEITQLWIDALDHFSGKMAHAGMLRGQVKKVFNAVGALKHGGPMPTLTTMSEPKISAKTGRLKHLVSESLMDTSTTGTGSNNDATDILHEVIVNASHGIKEGVDNVIDQTAGIVEEFGHEAVDLAKKAAKGVGDFVHDHAVQLGHIVGEGIHRFAQGAHSVINKVGHFLSSIF